MVQLVEQVSDGLGSCVSKQVKMQIRDWRNVTDYPVEQHYSWQSIYYIQLVSTVYMFQLNTFCRYVPGLKWIVLIIVM